MVERRGDFSHSFPLFQRQQNNFQVLVYAFTGYHLFIFSIRNSLERMKNNGNPLNS